MKKSRLLAWNTDQPYKLLMTTTQNNIENNENEVNTFNFNRKTKNNTIPQRTIMWMKDKTKTQTKTDQRKYQNAETKLLHCDKQLKMTMNLNWKQKKKFTDELIKTWKSISRWPQYHGNNYITLIKKRLRKIMPNIIHFHRFQCTLYIHVKDFLLLIWENHKKKKKNDASYYTHTYINK